MAESRYPLTAIAYERWRDMELKEVLDEMAVLFHLAVKIEEVKRLEETQRVRANAGR